MLNKKSEYPLQVIDTHFYHPDFSYFVYKSDIHILFFNSPVSYTRVTANKKGKQMFSNTLHFQY